MSQVCSTRGNYVHFVCVSCVMFVSVSCVMFVTSSHNTLALCYHVFVVSPVCTTHVNCDIMFSVCHQNVQHVGPVLSCIAFLTGSYNTWELCYHV